VCQTGVSDVVASTWVARFFLAQHSQTGGIYQIPQNIPKLPQNIPKNYHKTCHLSKIYLLTRVTRRVCEKVAQNVAQKSFVNLSTKLVPRKKVAPKFTLFRYFS
jgi:hypothetical protein